MSVFEFGDDGSISVLRIHVRCHLFILGQVEQHAHGRLIASGGGYAEAFVQIFW